MLLASAYLVYLLCAIVPCNPKFPQPQIPTKEDPSNWDSRESRWRRPLEEPSPPPRVKLRNGALVEGYFMKSSQGKSIAAFEGIPYAEAPVGINRFQPPIAKAPWRGTWLGKKPGPLCLQLNLPLGYSTIGSEDCLSLNVYSPAAAKNPETTRSRPVVIFIHGGAFIFGSGAEYGPSYWLNQDIILVSINYRLGVLGFLSTNDEVLPGNNGLKDQALAIRWVHENIGAFGGNSSDVTLCGHSAGGASVHFHMMSEWTRSYFHRGISLSGTGMNYWALSTQQRARELVNKLARRLRCPRLKESRKNSKAVVNCLRKRNPALLVSNQFNLLEWGPIPLVIFSPVVEPKGILKPFLSDTPQNLYAQNRVAKIPWITSATKEEAYFHLQLIYYFFKISELRSSWPKLAPLLLEYRNYSNKEEIMEKIDQFYFQGKLPKFLSDSALSKPITDRFFLQGIYESSLVHSQLAPTYSYIFDYKGKYNVGNVLGFKSKEWGVGHAEDIFYLFNNTGYYPGFQTIDKPEQELSQIMIQLLSNFVTTGEPLYGNISKGERLWRPYPWVLNFGQKEIQSIPNPFQSAVQFWQKLDLDYKNKF